MAFCPHCGASLLDDARFCTECGASIEPAQQAAPQQAAPQPQVSQQQPTVGGPNVPPPPASAPVGTPAGAPAGASAGAPATKNYETLGGWLLFFTICWGLAALFGLISLFASFGSLGATFKYAGASSGLLTVVLMLVRVFSIAISAIMVWAVVKRHPKFLRLYQILSIVSVCLSLLSTLLTGIGTRYAGGVIVASGIIGIAAGAGGLALMTMYFCKSVRVRTYMGSTEYLDTALFKIGA